MVDWYPINSSQWIINCYVYTYLYIYIYIVIIYIFILYAYIYSVCYTNILCMFMYYIYIYHIPYYYSTLSPMKIWSLFMGIHPASCSPNDKGWFKVDSRFIHDSSTNQTNIYFCNRANLSHLLLGSVTWRGCWIPNKSRRKKTPIVPMTFNC